MSGVFMSLKKLYGEILKVNDQDDGTIIVEGILSTEDVDSDGEIIKADAMRAAIPEYMKFGAIREMHQAKAAGTALEISVGEDNVTIIKAHIVDSEAIKKVKTGTYKGFSAGGKVTARDTVVKTTITGLNLVEASLVDRPANPSAVITCYKAEGIEPEPEVETAPEPEKLEKSFYSVARLARILEDVQDFCNYLEYEDQYEKRNADIPPIVIGAAKQFGAALQALVNNEVSALTTAGSEITQKSDDVTDLAKAGSRFSKATKAMLAEVHQTLRDCDAKLAAVGYDAESDDDAAEDEAEKAAQSDSLQKVSGELDLTKAELSKVQTERDTLQKRVKELEEQPEPPKAALMDLTKSADMGQQATDAVNPVVDSHGDVNEIATMIKAAQAIPFR